VKSNYLYELFIKGSLFASCLLLKAIL
jgi:hypothetical protein